MAQDVYIVPAGLDTPEVRSALADIYPAISDRHYVANDALCHSYMDRETRRALYLVESRTSRRLVEISGDLALWLQIRSVAEKVAQQRRNSATVSNGRPSKHPIPAAYGGATLPTLSATDGLSSHSGPSEHSRKR